MFNDDFEAGKIVITLNGDFVCHDNPDCYSDILDGIDYEKIEVIFRSKKNKRNMGDIILVYLRGKNKQAVIDAIGKITANPNVIFAEPDCIYECHVIPNDPYHKYLWGLEKIKAPSAWGYSTGSEGVVIGVVDSGIDYNHPDIKDNMWVTQNGQHGWDFLDNNDDPMDMTGHGTHVAGIAGAVGNNSIGISGVCWNVKVASLKIGNHVFNLASAIAAIDYANENDIPILNISWGGRYFSQSLKYAIDLYNGLFVVSAGNYGSNNDDIPDYPACYDSDNIIAVAASDQYGELAPFSNYGAVSIDIAAPGTDILSLSLNGGYDYQWGTSMAAPHVAGAAALLKSHMPDLTISDVKSIILSSADKYPNLDGKILSGGVLNISEMIETAIRLNKH
ncbi:MAG: S8 family serine peptidase [Defluviitaleaceae bacterium]|nr:S8 family serine peptidase [Defluviitaleaceae bacterium]